MAEVYWIHTKAQTDMFSSGYVGFTSRTAVERFDEHLSESRRANRRKDVIHKALLKYGNDIILEVLVKCGDEYGLWLEEKLRPEKKIGWNIVKGGSKPPDATGRKATDTQRKAQSVRMKASGVLPPTDDPAVRKKILATKENNGPWNNRPDTQLSRFWAKADLIYLMYNKFPSVSVEILCEAIQEDVSKRVHDITRYIRDNEFVPQESYQWCRDFPLNDTTAVDRFTDDLMFIKTQHYKHPKANSLWLSAAGVYQFLLDHPNVSVGQANRYYKLPDKSITTLYKKLKAGWNPSEDIAYQTWLTEYNKGNYDRTS